MHLTALQIETLRLMSSQLLDPVTNFLIEDIAKRVSEAGQLTGTASYLVWRAQNLGISQRKLKKELQKLLKVSQEEVEHLLTQAAETGYNFDISRFPTSHAIPFSANSNLQQVLDATVKQAQEDLSNITQTIGFVGSDGVCRELTKAYQQACDFAFQKVSTGAQDYISAVREATKNLVEKGIRTIDYESGVHTSVEAATRRNIMGGLGLMQEQISEKNHDDLGCNGWEISAHAASAPDHEPYQGKQYTDEEYTRLNNSLVRRIGTLNCGHAAFPIILGVNLPQYTDEELEQFRKDNETGVDFDGKHYSAYEATQRQRKLERSIRKQKQRILADEALGDKDKLQNDQIRLVRLQDEYRRFSKGTGLRTQHARMEMSGFGPKQAKAAEKTAIGSSNSKKTIANYNGSGTINKKATVRKITDRGEVINPMPVDEYTKIKTALNKQGVKVVAATDGDDLAYMLWMKAEGTYKNGWLRHIGEIPSRGTLYEEIIHMAQSRKYGELDASDYVELYAREIEANRKLLKYGKAYKLDDLDLADVERNLESWEYLFKKRTGVNYDESNYRKTV